MPMTMVYAPIIDAYRAYPRGAPDDGAVTITWWRLTAIVGKRRRKIEPMERKYKSMMRSMIIE